MAWAPAAQRRPPPPRTPSPSPPLSAATFPSSNATSITVDGGGGALLVAPAPLPTASAARLQRMKCRDKTSPSGQRGSRPPATKRDSTAAGTVAELVGSTSQYMNPNTPKGAVSGSG